MFAIAALALLTTTSAGFYSRFLVALCKEARLFKAWYLVRLEIRADELQIVDEPEIDESASIAA